MPAEADIEILRAFEPVLRYTHGEKFFPMSVEPYVRSSSLWLRVPAGTDEEVVPEGELTLEQLEELRDAPFGSVFYLLFVQPLDLTGSAAALAGERPPWTLVDARWTCNTKPTSRPTTTAPR